VEYLIWKIGEIHNDGSETRNPNTAQDVDVPIIEVYRAIDDTSDRIVHYERGGKGKVTLISEIPNEVEFVPAVQVSTLKNELRSDLVKTSPIAHLIPMLNRYLSKDSFQTITEVKHAFPKLAAMGVSCPLCNGEKTVINKNTSKESICPKCGGYGLVSPFKKDSFLVMPQSLTEGHIFPPGAPATYITPDNDSVRFGDEKLDKIKERILFAGTGNKSLVSEEIARTATESVINHKSLEDRIGEILNIIEFVESFLTDTIGLMHNTFKSSYQGCTIKYGRKLNLRDENTFEISQLPRSTGETPSFGRHRAPMWLYYQRDLRHEGPYRRGDVKA